MPANSAVLAAYDSTSSGVMPFFFVQLNSRMPSNLPGEEKITIHFFIAFPSIVKRHLNVISLFQRVDETDHHRKENSRSDYDKKTHLMLLLRHAVVCGFENEDPHEGGNSDDDCSSDHVVLLFLILVYHIEIAMYTIF